MGEKNELKHFFTCNGKVIETIPEISISDGTVIEGGILHRNEDGTLCSIGKPLSIELECKLSDELFWTLVAPNRINQNNFRKIHGIPKRRKINGSRKNKRLSEWTTQVQQVPAKEIVDFAKVHPCDYMRKSLQQYPYWGNEDNGFNRQKFKEIFNEH